MKIIDLLDKIANGEEVPKKILYKDEIFEYNNNDYESIHSSVSLLNYFGDDYIRAELLDEVKILETSITYNQDSIDNNKQIKKEGYLADCSWEHIRETNKGGVTATIVFKDGLTLEEYEELLKYKNITLVFNKNEQENIENNKQDNIEKLKKLNAVDYILCTNIDQMKDDILQNRNKINEIIDKLNGE